MLMEATPVNVERAYPPTWASYRAACIPHATGCRQCGKDIKPHRAYCSRACRQEFNRNHFWQTAAAHALDRSRPGGERSVRNAQGQWIIQKPLCRACGKACDWIEDKRFGRREAEVNHIAPVNGNRPHFGCCHHQANLEVLCHGCHVAVTNEQRRAGLIGRHAHFSPQTAAAGDPGERGMGCQVPEPTHGR
jgi:hypothetical protein